MQELHLFGQQRFKRERARVAAARPSLRLLI